MALFIEFIVVMVISLVVSFLFMTGFDRFGPWGAVWTFVILFLGTWAIGVWTQPLGPAVWNVYWLPYLVAAAILGGLLYLVLPPGTAADTDESSRSERIGTAIVLAVGGGFWLLLLLSAAAIVAGYFWPRG